MGLVAENGGMKTDLDHRLSFRRNREMTFRTQLVSRMHAATGRLHDAWLSLTRPRPAKVPRAAAAVLGPGAVNLPVHRVIQIVAGSGVRRIHVHHGYAWLTSTPAGGDVLLRGGEQHQLYGDPPFVLEALSDVRIDLLA